MNMEEKKVAYEVAEKEVVNWLNFRKTGESNRLDEGGDGYSDSVKKLIDAVQMGTLSIDQDTFEITHNLAFSVNWDDGDIAFDELKYKPRVTVGMFQRELKGVKASDGDGRILAYISALTEKTKGELKKLDSSDGNIAQTIALFFML